MSERFSVSMCVYGGDDPGHFDDALHSVIQQTVRPDEIVLTVDGPIPEETKEVIRKYQQLLSNSATAFHVICLAENRGHGEARRICLENCSHDLVALMDADDLSVPDRFERQLRYFAQHPELSVVGGQIHEFVDVPEHCVGKRLVPEHDADIKAYMKKRCPMNQVTVIFRKTDVAAVGGYIDWYCEEDYYLWLRLALAGYRFGNVPDNLVYVRVGEEMYSRRGGMKYFRSETKLQKYMLRNKLISLPRYAINVMERLVLQVLMPTGIRGFLFRKLARL